MLKNNSNIYKTNICKAVNFLQHWEHILAHHKAALTATLKGITLYYLNMYYFGESIFKPS